MEKRQSENIVLNINIWFPLTLAILERSIIRNGLYDIYLPYIWLPVAIRIPFGSLGVLELKGKRQLEDLPPSRCVNCGPRILSDGPSYISG